MKVLLLNGSPREMGCTYTALSEVADALEREGVEAEIVWIGNDRYSTCKSCGYCKQTGRCVDNADSVNRVIEKAKTADGFVFGSPVHYAGASGALTSFLSRFFVAGSGFRGKPGAAVVSCRRGGATAALDQINKYFPINGMPVVPSQYWNEVHGNTPDEVRQDLEGMQILRTLGRNMAWMLRCFEAGRKAGISLPEPEPRAKTNFIR